MPRDGSGNYTLPVNSVDPAVPITTISSTDFNQLTLDLGTELTDSLDRSGKGAMLASLGMGGFKIANLGAPGVASDAARLDTVTGIVLAGDVTGPTNTNLVANVPGGKVTGLAAGSYAPAGKVGEVFFASQTVALSTGVTKNVTSVPLTAGNWLIFAEAFIAPAALMQNINVAISTANAALSPLVGNAYLSISTAVNTTFASGIQLSAPVGMAAISIAAPATYYLNANCTFTSTMNIGGVLTAVRLG